MLKNNELVGVIVIYRQEVRPFTGKQIELVQNFAAQAVVAIENTRLLNELRQRTDDLTRSLEQQTATSEVLRVISSSPGELEPVFQSMLQNAVQICDANFGTLYRFDGKMYHMAASVGTPLEFDEFQRRRGPFQPTPGTGRVLKYRVEDRLQVAGRCTDYAQHLRRGFLLLQQLVPLAGKQRVGVGAGRLATTPDLWRTGALWLSRRASPVFHGIAVCCACAHCSDAAAATPRLPEYSRRFMLAPGSGDGIVSAQTNALEGAWMAYPA